MTSKAANTAPSNELQIGIWGVQRSGKSTYIYALEQALRDADFFVLPRGPRNQVDTFLRNRQTFSQQHVFFDPTEIGTLTKEDSWHTYSSHMTVEQHPVEESLVSLDPPARPSILDEAPGDALGPTGPGQSEVSGSPRSERTPITVDQDEVLKLDIGFPVDVGRIARLPFVAKNAPNLTGRRYSLWLPDHAGEIWTVEDHRSHMDAMLEYYSQDSFNGFLLFLDPTFYPFETPTTHKILGRHQPYDTSLSDFLYELIRRKEDGGRLRASVAVVFTKTDEPRFRPYAKYPKLLAELVLGRAPFRALTSLMQDESNISFFCSSSAGTTETGSNVKEVAGKGRYTMRRAPSPEGVMDPLMWITSRAS